MSPQQVVKWSEAFQAFLVPALLGVASLVGGWLATELGNLRQDVGDLKVQVARLQERLDMHMQSKQQ